jgi:hypothetical protein
MLRARSRRPMILPQILARSLSPVPSSQLRRLRRKSDSPAIYSCSRATFRKAVVRPSATTTPLTFPRHFPHPSVSVPSLRSNSSVLVPRHQPAPSILRRPQPSHLRRLHHHRFAVVSISFANLPCYHQFRRLVPSTMPPARLRCGLATESKDSGDLVKQKSCMPPCTMRMPILTNGYTIFNTNQF